MDRNLDQMIQKAMKALTVPDLGSSRLEPAQAAEFVRIVEKESVLLGAARRLDLQRDRRNIDRTGFAGRLLQEPADEGEDFTDRKDPSFYTNELVAQKARGAVRISDEALAENIEQEAFEDTLLDMIAERASIDLEELLLAGGTDSDDAFLELVDGWLVEAGNSLDAEDFDESDIEDVFDTMLLAVDDKYLRDLTDWRFWCTWAHANAYRDTLRARETALGDTAQTGAEPLFFKGIRVQPVPVMPEGRALFGHVDNTVYGIRTDVEIEPERRASYDAWDFHVRVRADAHYEDENAAVAADGIDV